MKLKTEENEKALENAELKIKDLTEIIDGLRNEIKLGKKDGDGWGGDEEKDRMIRKVLLENEELKRENGVLNGKVGRLEREFMGEK